ncbi:hypothetical protein V2I22_02845 [Campylobacter sp. CLAX-7218-21]|uniref:hypothetical protein n=1 Tax=Campylobacter devanensis TaxID=3161138 RepID=UPI002EC78B39|nr:hypothetical protein [Campylobacter sp. CLAX-7218-21]
MLFILLNGVKSEVYNIANPNSIATIAQYAQILANIAKVNLKFELPDEIEQKDILNKQILFYQLKS